MSGAQQKLERARMPIMGATLLGEIPWALIAPHETQAYLNHSQSLNTLASRGGLAASEALDILESRRWGSTKPCIETERRLINKVREWRAAAKNAEAMTAPIQEASTHAVTDEIALIRSVLRGYPTSFASRDALRALDAIERALAARAAPGQALPEGFVLVPVEPTDDMEAAAENDYEDTGATFPDWKSAYRAMLKAAAQPCCSRDEGAPEPDDTSLETGEGDAR